MPFEWPTAGVSASAVGSRKENPVALKPYKVKVYGHETTLLLSDEDAKREGLLKPEEKKAVPENKARTAKNKKR